MAHEVPKELQSFRNFLFYLWKELNLPEPTDVQYDIADFLSKGPKRRMVQAFRGVGKSWITAAYVMWKLLLDPNERIMVVSASKDRADAFSIFVKRCIEEVEWLSHLVPDPKKNHRDSNVAFDVGPSEKHQAPSVRSIGITGQMTGGRATLIVADDIETPKNSLTLLQRERLSELVKEFDAILIPGGDVVYLGTPQCEESVYTSLPERGYTVRTWPARVPDSKWREYYQQNLSPWLQQYIEDHEEGDTTDPDRFDNEDLKDREMSYGRSGFALQFMLDTRLSDENKYPLKLRDLVIMGVGELAPLKVVWGASNENLLTLPAPGLKGDRYHGPAFTHKDYVEFNGSVMFIDPSGRGEDETSYAVVKIANSMLFLTDVGGFKDGYSDEVMIELSKTAKRNDVNLVLVEPNFGDGMFNRLFEPHLREIHPCKVEDGPRATTQKEARIISILEPVMNQHRLIVADTVVKKDFAVEDPAYQLMYQLTRLTKEKGALRHDDRLEAVSGAVQYWISQLARSVDSAASAAEERAIEKELEDFHKHVLGHRSTEPLTVADEYTL